MKIIHTSDLHLASPLTTRLSHLEAAARKRELTESFRRIIDIAVKECAEAIIIAGDLFDSDRINARTLSGITEAIDAARGITFLYLPGNHERDLLVSSGISLPDNLKIFGKEWTYYTLSGVTFAGRSEIPRDAFSTLELSKDRTNFVVLHGVLADRCDGEERIGLRDLEGLPIDYLALGHYHTYSSTEISSRAAAVYSGTPEGRGFDETGAKGFVKVSVTPTGVGHVFVPSAARRLHAIEVDISGAVREMDIEDRVRAALEMIPREDLVRVILTGEHEPSLRRDVDSLAERFKSGRFFLEVRDSSRMRISADDYKNDISLKGEFIRLVLADESLDEGDKEAIIELGLTALAGETI